jgi:hypothetical protein
MTPQSCVLQTGNFFYFLFLFLGGSSFFSKKTLVFGLSSHRQSHMGWGWICLGVTEVQLTWGDNIYHVVLEMLKKTFSLVTWSVDSLKSVGIMMTQ